MRRLVEPVLVVPRVLLDGTLAPEQVDVVLQREEMESAPGQDVGLVLGVDGIAGVLWNGLSCRSGVCIILSGHISISGLFFSNGALISATDGASRIFPST